MSVQTSASTHPAPTTQVSGTDPEQPLWDAYNLLLTGPDIERIRKVMVREHFFRMVNERPGDIVEAGVLKGAGFMLWLKLLAIFAPGSAKRVVGFDLFGGWEESAPDSDKALVTAMVEETGFRNVTRETVIEMARVAGLEKRCDLVEGDIRTTARSYVEAHPGFRISLLHLDLDHEEATEAALEALYPRVVRGGVIVLDEYAVPKWSESHGVDRFLERHGLQLSTLPWARTPTAYLVKP